MSVSNNSSKIKGPKKVEIKLEPKNPPEELKKNINQSY
jgi:hypothetical protein